MKTILIYCKSKC